MRIEAIAIGSELLTAGRLDTNSVWIADRLAPLGLAFYLKTAVGDDAGDLAATFRAALQRSDWIICTGGLGPTFDDITKEVWCEVLGDRLEPHAEAMADLQAFFTARNRVPSQNNQKQAWVPVGAARLPNPHGTAPGIIWKNPKGFPGRTVVLMPGVPREMKAMWEHHVEPDLAPFAGTPARTLRMVTCGVPESTLDERTQVLRQKHGDLAWTILSSYTHVELLARSSDWVALERAEQDFRELLGADLVNVGPGGVERVLLENLVRRQETFAVAESMTGGLLAARFTAEAGASQVFLGGATVYSPEAKVVLVDVNPDGIQRDGTVSTRTTRALAEGIRNRLGATWGLAVTGNAGPSEDRLGPAPVGTTYIAVAGPGGTTDGCYVFPGARGDIQTRAAVWAMDALRRRLLA